MSARSKPQGPYIDPCPLPELLAQTHVVSEELFSLGTVAVAQALLGCVLLHNDTAGMIVETEAYLGLDDLAAHSSKGETPRTKAIFGPPGHAYVYFIYGMHECLNITAEPAGTPGCVLIRALQPLCGLEEMRVRRQWAGSPIGLANGPGKLTEALGITREHYGRSLQSGSLTVREWKKSPDVLVEVTRRIGIRYCADWPLRFLWRGNEYVSKAKP